MKTKCPNEPMQVICKMYGVTRQAYYSLRSYETKCSVTSMLALALVKEVKKDIPNIGGRKLYHMLNPEFDKHHVQMGRDLFFDLLRFHGLLVRRRKRNVKTTDSFHRFRKYPNLIEEYQVNAPEQLWVADITYIRTAEGYSYLCLITDAYSRKIVGYALHPTLEAKGCVIALKMALQSRTLKHDRNLIHHSDRGIQYCCNEYIELLKKGNIEVSMTQSGNPYDNALAERMNCTIKNDYFTGKMYRSHEDASTEMQRIVSSYNQRRPHQSLNYLTPEQAHQLNGEINKRWKKYKKRSKQTATPPNGTAIDANKRLISNTL